MITYRNANLFDALSLSTRLRETDRVELYHSTGEGPAAALKKSFEWSEEVECAVEDGTVIAIWGIVRVNDKLGVPWMVGSDALSRFPVRLVAYSRAWVARQLARYACLANYVHAGNHTSIRWLEALGFAFDPPAPFGVNQQLFMKFHQTACAIQ